MSSTNSYSDVHIFMIFDRFQRPYWIFMRKYSSNHINNPSKRFLILIDLGKEPKCMSVAQIFPLIEILHTLCTLPQTNVTFIQNVHRCYLQVAVWKAALLESSPKMDLTKYGWDLDRQGILLPQTVPPKTLSVSLDILNLIHCSCKTSGCQTTSCTCSKLGS